MTLTESLSRYFDAQGRVSQNVQVELRRFVRWCGASRDVQTLEAVDIAEYTASQGTSGGDTRERLSALKSFLSYLKREGITAHSLANAVKVSRAKAGEARSESPDHAPVHLTPDGYKALQKQLREMKAQKGALSEDIRRAAADKDVRENAPLEAAREQKGHVDSRIRELEQRMQRAARLEKVVGGGGPIQLGHQVVLRDATTGREVVYTLVHPTEADPLQGRISIASPVGKALLGQMPGQQVRVAAPRGDVLYHIVNVKQ